MTIATKGGALFIKDGRLVEQCACCGGPCPCEPGGQLPDTVTVTLSGPQGTKEQGPPLLSLKFESCFGSGAAGTATAPGGVPGEDIGPISGVTLTNAGSGYAKLGRSVPTLTFANTGDPSAEVTLNLTEGEGDCGLPYWSITSVTITSAGAGHASENLAITLPEGGVEELAAVATLEVGNGEPTLEAEATPGTGAVFEVTVAENDPAGTWGVSGVTVTGTPTGYEDGTLLTFSGDGVTEQEAAVARIYSVREEPTVTLSVGGGNGDAVLTATLASNGDTPETWELSGITIEDGGTGYSQFNNITVVVVDGVEVEAGFGQVTSVDGNGAITGVVVTPDLLGVNGRYYKPTGVLAGVHVEYGGEYFVEGALQGVSISNGGRYYVEDADLPPLVADVTVTVRQLWPGDGGSGAEISATVNDDTSSEDFGKIDSLEVDDGGDNYTGWRWIYSCDCDWVYYAEEGEAQDRTIVAWRTNSQCTEGSFGCDFVGYQCWPTPADLQNLPYIVNPCLVRLRLTSDIKTEDFILLEAPFGVPGRDNGPVTGVFFEDYLDSQLTGWAFLNDDGNVVAPAVTAEVFDYLPSQGSGAAFSVSVNTNPDSDDFGRVTLTLTSGGDGYLSAVPGAGSPVIVTYPGPNSPPTVTVSGPGCQTTLTADEPVTCENFSFEATFGDQTVSVAPGGDVAEIFEGSNECCGRCYIPCPERPTQLTVTFTREAAEGYAMREADQTPFALETLNFPGSIGNPFGPGNTEFYYIDCPGHEVEAVFDLEDVENDLTCPPFFVCVGDGQPGSGDSLVVFNNTGVLLDCDVGNPGHYIDDGVAATLDESTTPNDVWGLPYTFIPNFSSITVTVGPPNPPTEITFAWARVSFGGEGQPHTVETSSSVSALSTKTKTHTLDGGFACADDGEWRVTESDDGTPQDGLYDFQFGPSPYWKISVGTMRRICHHYEIDFEFS